MSTDTDPQETELVEIMVPVAGTNEDGTPKPPTKYRLLIGRADILAEARYYRLLNEGEVLANTQYGAYPEEIKKWKPGDPDLEQRDPDRYVLRSITFPTLLASLLNGPDSGLPWPLTFDKFCHLPGELWAEWGAANRRMNPTWYAPLSGAASDPKGPSGSTTA